MSSTVSLNLNLINLFIGTGLEVRRGTLVDVKIDAKLLKKKENPLSRAKKNMKKRFRYTVGEYKATL